MGGLVAEHAVTRSVRDSAALLDATSGPDVGDPYWAPPPARPYAEEIRADPGRLRIAFSVHAASGTKIHQDCVDAVMDVAELCASLGHEVVDDAPKISSLSLAESFLAVWAAGCSAGITASGLLTGQTPKQEQFEPLTWSLYEMGQRVTGPAYVMAITNLQRIARQVGQFMEKYDACLTPTVAEPPLLLGTLDSTAEDPMRAFYRAVEFVPFTPIANVTGQPAMSVPLYWNAEGLPIGTQFIGRFGDEATLFRLAAQLEAARPWANRRPPIAV